MTLPHRLLRRPSSQPDALSTAEQPSRTFAAAIAVIVAMAVVNMVAFVAIQQADSTLHDQSTSSLMAAQQLQFDVADMNGAQNLYVLDNGISRRIFEASQRRLELGLAAAKRADTSRGDRALLRALTRDAAKFRALDAQVFAAIQRGDHAAAVQLTIAPETAVYYDMTQTSRRLVADSSAERVASLASLNRIERGALIVMLTLDGLAAVLVVALLADRRRTGVRLRTRTAEHQTLIEQIPAATHVYDAKLGRRTFVSPQYLEMYGLDREQVESAGFDWQSRLHEDDRERVTAAWQHSMASGTPWAERYRWTCGDGRQIWVAGAERRIVGSDHLWMGVAFDVSDAVATAQQLSETSAIYRHLIEQLPLIVYRDDVQTGQPLFVSPQIEPMLGYTVDEWMAGGHSAEWWQEKIHPDDLAERERAAGIVDGRVTAPEFTATYRVRHHDGRYRWVQEQATTVPDEQGVERWRHAIILDIHDRVVAERGYEDLINRMPATSTIWDRDTKWAVFASPQIEQLTGEPAEAWVGGDAVDRFRSRVHPDDLADPTRWRPADDPNPGVYRWTRSDGRTIWIREITSPRPGSDSEYIALLFDVTSEVEAALALVEQRRRYQTLVEQLPVATYIIGPDGAVTYASPQAEQILGRTPADLVAEGTTLERQMTWFHPDDVKPLLGATIAFREGRIDRNSFQARMVHADGGFRHVRVIARALKDADGSMQGIQGVVIDVSDEVAARSDLEASERRYAALVEQTPVTTYLTDADGRIVYISAQVEQLLGIPPEQYLREYGEMDARLRRVYHPDDHDRLAQTLADLLSGAVDSVDHPARVITATGDVREVQLVARTLRDPSGAVTHTQGVIVDLTDLRGAERRSREVMAALVTAAEAEQARIAVELHDDTVQVMAALLMQVHMLMRTHPSLAATATMVADALDRTRRLMFELRPQILEREGLGAALTRIAADGPWSEATVEIELPRQSVTVEAIVYRAVRELIINARKHSKATRLEISGHQQDGLVVFDVADDGDGFDPAVALDRKRMEMHIGLDATIERIRLAGGELTVDSAPGHGARFRLTLPAEPLPAEPAGDQPVAVDA